MDQHIKALSDASDIEALERRLEMSTIILAIDPIAVDCGTFKPTCGQLDTCGTFG